MEKTAQKIQKVTSKGQITLPSSWRKQTNTDQVLVVTKGNKIEITPARLAVDEKDYTVFDAIRDNSGKGIMAEDLLKILKKIDKKS